MSEQEDGACYTPIQEYCCEICGLSGLTDEIIREHTRICHVEGNAQCPFCGLSGVVPAELLLHVNQAHLDYLTPENELINFIDCSSLEEDSDSITENKTISSQYNHVVDSFNHQDEVVHKSSKQQQPQQQQHQHHKNFQSQDERNIIYETPSCSNTSRFSPPLFSLSSLSSSSSSSLSLINNERHNKDIRQSNNKNYDLDLISNDSNNDKKNSSKDFTDIDLTNEQKSQQIKGSPLKSQLGLKLKGHTFNNDKKHHHHQQQQQQQQHQQSPLLQCPLCPHTSDNARILEEHINRSHFDPLSPSINNSSSSINQCPICIQIFESCSDLELHVNIEHKDILSPGKNVHNDTMTLTAGHSGSRNSICPVCNISLDNMKPKEMELHIEGHFTTKNIKNSNHFDSDIEKEAQKLREQREFEMLRAQYGMDDQGNFREQSAAAMQRAVYAGEMSVADYYERQVGLRAAESHGIDDGTSCTKSVTARVSSLSSSSPGVIKSIVCSSVDHYASNYGDKGWGCGYRNLQMLLSSLLQNTTFNEALYSAWGTHGPSRTAMPSISRLQKMVEAAWAQGFDIQGSEQLGCKLYNTRKWIGATEVVTVLSWLRINCQLIDFHCPTSSDGRHPELFNWVLEYFSKPRVHTPPLYLQHQGHSRTIIGIEQRVSGLTLLVLDPSHGPRQVAALGLSQDSLRLIRRGPSAMRAPQYQIVAVSGLIETEEQYQASKILRSLRIPPDR